MALIAGLALIVFYLAVRWSGSRAENGKLRAQIASLKRQLVKRGGR